MSYSVIWNLSFYINLYLNRFPTLYWTIPDFDGNIFPLSLLSRILCRKLGMLVGPPSWILYPPSWILYPPSWILYPTLCILDLSSCILDPPSWILNPPSWILLSWYLRPKFLAPNFTLLLKDWLIDLLKLLLLLLLIDWWCCPLFNPSALWYRLKQLKEINTMEKYFVYQKALISTFDTSF